MGTCSGQVSLAGQTKMTDCRSGMPVLAFCRGTALVVVLQKGLNQAAHLLSCTAQIHTLLILSAQQQAGFFQIMSTFHMQLQCKAQHQAHVPQLLV